MSISASICKNESFGANLLATSPDDDDDPISFSISSVSSSFSAVSFLAFLWCFLWCLLCLWCFFLCFLLWWELFFEKRVESYSPSTSADFEWCFFLCFEWPWLFLLLCFDSLDDFFLEAFTTGLVSDLVGLSFFTLDYLPVLVSFELESSSCIVTNRLSNYFSCLFPFFISFFFSVTGVDLISTLAAF